MQADRRLKIEHEGNAHVDAQMERIELEIWASFLKPRMEFMEKIFSSLYLQATF